MPIPSPTSSVRNVLFIMADQLRWDYLSWTGHPTIRTPYIDALTRAVQVSFADTPKPRLREIMVLLVRHLHGFAREARLTQDEWFQGIRFLTQVGQTCSDTRQEFILLSDVRGCR